MGGVVGTLQATEALKYLLGMDGLLNGQLLTYNALTMEFRKVKIAHNPNCQVCGEKPSITTLIDYEQAVCDLREYHNSKEAVTG
jgi:molybdopterin/thiamine biosynthesis adenylyltransferase